MKLPKTDLYWALFSVAASAWNFYVYSLNGNPVAIFGAGVMLGLAAMFVMEGLHKGIEYCKEELRKIGAQHE